MPCARYHSLATKIARDRWTSIYASPILRTSKPCIEGYDVRLFTPSGPLHFVFILELKPAELEDGWELLTLSDQYGNEQLWAAIK